MLTAGVVGLTLATRGRGNFPYASTVSWALAGIAVANTARNREPVVATIACVLAVLLLASTWRVTRRVSTEPPA